MGSRDAMVLKTLPFLCALLSLNSFVSCKSRAPRKPNPAADTALMRAFADRDNAKIRSALNEGAKVNVRNPQGVTLIEYAVESGDMALVDEVIDAGADLSATTRGFTPLMSAAWEGRTPMVKKLVRSGADVNARDDYGRTAVMLAILRNKFEAVKYLAENNADLNLRESDGLTALDIATRYRQKETAAYLKSRGAKHQESAGTTTFRPSSPEYPCEEGKRYNLVIAFGNRTERPMLGGAEVVRSLVRKYPKYLPFGSGGHGPDGEYSYCFTLEGLSKEETRQLTHKMRDALAQHKGVTVRSDATVYRFMTPANPHPERRGRRRTKSRQAVRR